MDDCNDVLPFEDDLLSDRLLDLELKEQGRLASLRTCIVTGETLPKNKLLRFVVSPQNVLVPDMAEKLPGKGIWVSATRENVDLAVAKNNFTKAARKKLNIPDNLSDLVESLLAKRICQWLGMAAKSGTLAAGFVQVNSLLKSGKVVQMFCASDAAEDGAEKMARLANKFSKKDAPVCNLLSRDELGAALGREQVVHVALAHKALSAKIVDESYRLAGFRKKNTIYTYLI